MNITAPDRNSVPEWRVALAALGLAMAAVLFAYWSNFVGMVGVWSRSDTFAHAYLVAPISLWLIWRRRSVLSMLRPRPQWIWLLAILAAGLAWLLADLAAIAAATQFLAVATLILVVPAVTGWRVTRTILFPLGFLLFMVPIGEFAMPALMEWTADVTVAGIGLLGIPVYRDGLQFVIPSGQWSVVEACSGVRYLIASFMVGTLFAYLNYKSTTRRVAFAVVAIVVPVLANWARAIMIVLLGHYSGNTLAVGVDHLVYGWVFFGIVIMAMFSIGTRWSEDVTESAPSALEPGPGTSSVATLAVLAMLLVVVFTPGMIASRLDEHGGNVPELSANAWPGPAAKESTSAFRPVFERPSAQLSTALDVDGVTVQVHIAYYRNQGYGHKLVTSSNTLVRSDDVAWHRTQSGRRTVQSGTASIELRTAEVRGGSMNSGEGVRLNVRQVLWSGGRYTSSDYSALAFGVLAQLMGRGDDAAAITWHVANRDAAVAERVLDAFAREQLGPIDQWLSSVRQRR